jgi:hypothetical protein
MTMTKFAVGAAAAVAATLLATAAFAAQGEGGYTCQTWNPTKAGPAVTHCVTWTHEAAARMRAADCDPATMSDAAMRDLCMAMMSEPAGKSGKHPGGIGGR